MNPYKEKLDQSAEQGMTSQSAPWPDSATAKAEELHQLLLIGDRDWHQLKSNQKRRGAELLAAALVQLLRQGDNRDVEDLTQQALGWVTGELKDPGCPRH